MGGRRWFGRHSLTAGAAAVAAVLAGSTAPAAPDAGAHAPPPAPTRTVPPPSPPSAKPAPPPLAPPAATPKPPAAPAKPTPPPAKPPAHPPVPTGKPAAHATAPKPPSHPSHPSASRAPDAAGRRAVAAGPTVEESQLGADTPELRALAAAERELFPPAMPSIGSPWPSELPSPLVQDPDRPRVHASGLPPPPPPSAVPVAEGGKDLSWLSKLAMPDLPVRWDARVVRYLEFFKDDPRGHAVMAVWLKRSGRYKDMVQRTLRKKGAPEDLLYLSMIESGFEPTARSPVGALGLWQFMPETGRVYGLPQDRWADGRLNVTLATEAAADLLVDLHKRFGTWELAMAAYNMGYGGILSMVKKYNTNDYWVLSQREGSLPWETTLYVPKILAVAVVAKNLATFGFDGLALDPPALGEEVAVAPGTPLAAVAQAAGCAVKEVEVLNPELRAGRTPPAGADYPVRVPAGKGAICSQNLAKGRREAPAHERVTVRFGETLAEVAAAHKVPVGKLMELNGITPGEVVRGGTVLLVPKAGEAPGAGAAAPAAPTAKPVVVVPPDVFVYPDRKRVFYRVVTGDTLKDVANQFKVTVDEIRRWNEIDPQARLVEGMTLQLFVPDGVDLSKTVALADRDVVPLTAGTDEFFNHFEERGRKRQTVKAKAGETLEQVGKRHQVSGSLMERINRRPRADVLKEGELVVIYTAPTTTPPAHASRAVAPWPAPPAPSSPQEELAPLP